MDTQYERYITCPYCGHKDINSWECLIDSSDDMECPECLEHFFMERIIDITYSTFKREAKNG